MSRVYLVQRPAFKTESGWVDKYDLSQAQHFGELVELLPRGNVPRAIDTTMDALRRGLAGFTDADYLLAVGDPVAIAAAAAVAAAVNDGRLRVLKWDRRTLEYVPYQLDARR